MELNDAGQMINKWWNELNNKYHNIELHEHITMPNHFHGIIQIVGADLRVCPDGAGEQDVDTGEQDVDTGEQDVDTGEHIGSPLHAMVQWFKTMTTNEYIRNVKQNDWPPFPGKLWQRNYYEHIIRDEKSYNKISQYIINNPMNWQDDKYYG